MVFPHSTATPPNHAPLPIPAIALPITVSGLGQAVALPGKRTSTSLDCHEESKGERFAHQDKLSLAHCLLSRL